MTDAPALKRYAFEDFLPGVSFALGPKLVTAEEIVAFAREFDPQPFHLDEAAGRESILGGLAASGWHVCAMFMRMMCDSYLLDATSQGAPGIEEARWKRPVLAGDTLSGKSTVQSARASNSRPEIGIVSFRHELFNQRGESVFELENAAMFRRRLVLVEAKP
ncbi:MAG TPA: MaoC family dehydratase [Mesorhizobium sp.]|jgi:acyl dehydratase|nr:MaoC family dehydratase [Mesorhizobium sp.]